jgi:hypothetical protein
MFGFLVGWGVFWLLFWSFWAFAGYWSSKDQPLAVGLVGSITSIFFLIAVVVGRFVS